MTDQIHHRGLHEPRTTARAAGAACLAIMLALSLAILLAILLARLPLMDAGTQLLAATALLALAAGLVLSVPLLDHLPAPRRRSRPALPRDVEDRAVPPVPAVPEVAAPVLTVPAPRQVRQPVAR